ncbi:DUF4189 domain-containing protein [Neisseria sp. DTU_2021_1001991_1_SI_NGA_ILE_055]|uniref:DUF4189 domain-containing protein n=1 Tax=Neisseria sp. DTU_2021_1001991_1_SI_NGA_ILE_055 TaxID=3077590 RepID=UPI0028EF4C3A|nr:DUF4189 domain-containing protein [Neisseria sp. DTU_2021_1001991_1_SI_NGA_ILE_055]WNS83024.1 DUF4189 domain-containing protein [Neisseria sp. DTU_2021_1001991_1_SI_NGA_ILE_055]
MKKLFFVLLGLASLNVCVANPTYDATRGALQNDPGLCQYGYNPNCGSSRQNQRNQPTEIIHIKVPSKYGAWAINSKTGISGGALEMDSLEEAKKQAIKTCEQGGKNKPCKIGAWVRNGCIAAAQRKDGRLFFGINDPGLAEVEALRKCQASGGIQCKITTPEGCSMPRF